MSEKSDKPAKARVKDAKGEVAAQEEGQAKPASRLSWVVGWVLVPAAVVAVIFGSGAVVGAHFHDSWYSRLVVWTIELFV